MQAATDSVNKSSKTKGFTFRKKAPKLGWALGLSKYKLSPKFFFDLFFSFVPLNLEVKKSDMVVYPTVAFKV
jgi:hypothetical protein